MKLKPREPKFKGMKVINVRYINTNDVDKFARKNKARKEGIQGTQVAKFEKLIKAGVYEPWYNIPPVVIQMPGNKYELVAGEHRFQAHKGQNKNKFWVAIVEFDTVSNKLLYQSIENKLDTSYTATPRSLDDIVNSAKSILIEEGFSISNIPSDHKIWKVIKSLEISTEEAHQTEVHEKVKKEMGFANHDIQTYSAKTGKALAAKINNDDPTPYTTRLYNTDKGSSRDLDVRLYFEQLELKLKFNNPAQKYNVYAHWQKVKGEKIPEARINKQKFWNQIEDKIINYAKILMSPDYVSPTLIPLPQIESDENV